MVLARLRPALLPVAAVVVALVFGAVLVLAGGHDPLAAAAAIWRGSLADRAAIGATLEKATPLVFAGLAVTVGLRAGLFNIGAQGQLLLGSVMAAYVGFRLHGVPTVVHVPLALAAGVLAGSGPALLAGVLKATRGVHEVIVTIMLNTVLVNLTDWLAGGPWREPGQAISRTPSIESSAGIGRIADLPVGFGLAVVTAAATWFVLDRTTLGFRLVTVGRNRHAAQYAGLPVRWVTVTAMALSGALAGLGGAVETQGVVGRFEPGFSRGLGFDGITIALLAKTDPRTVVPAALLIGVLRAASTQLQGAAQVPPEIVDVVLAAVLFLVAAPMVLRRLLGRGATADAAPLSLGTGWTS